MNRQFPIALALVISLGVVVGLWIPRGPVTSAQAVITIALSLGVGASTGLLIRSRWAAVLTPVVFAAVFELVRAGSSGPMVDGLHLTSLYGWMAFVLGRGLTGLLTLFPLAFGALLGAARARHLHEPTSPRSGWSTTGLWARRGVAMMTGVALATLVVGLSRPASTAPIAGANSIAELTRVDIGGHDLSLLIRGTNADNPVLLFLAGGPGGGEMGAMRRHGKSLEDEFTVVTFDQRGAGTSYDQLDPTSSLTLKAAVSDAVEVTNYLRSRLHQDKIYVLGNSWGTTLGILAVQQHPELYRAYIGTGQMVSIRETDRIFYADTLAWARTTGNTGLVDTLTNSGPPPYSNVLDYEPALTHEVDVHPYDHSPNDEGAGQFSENIFVKEHTLLQQLHMLPAFFDVLAVLYPQLQEIDFRTDVPRLAVPVYLIEGKYESPGRSVPAHEWFKALDAPIKKFITFDTSGHRPLFEQPALFNRTMADTVLAETRPVE